MDRKKPTIRDEENTTPAVGVGGGGSGGKSKNNRRIIDDDEYYLGTELSVEEPQIQEEKVVGPITEKKKSGRTEQEGDELDEIFAELGELPPISKSDAPPPLEEKVSSVDTTAEPVVTVDATTSEMGREGVKKEEEAAATPPAAEGNKKLPKHVSGMQEVVTRLKEAVEKKKREEEEKKDDESDDDDLSEFLPKAVFPCVLKIIPNCIFNKMNPIVLGVVVLEGVARVGTPICIPSRECIDIGYIASIENNRNLVDYARKDQKVAIKILGCNAAERAKMFGRHFEIDDELVSHITRGSIDALKTSHRHRIIGSIDVRRTMFNGGPYYVDFNDFPNLYTQYRLRSGARFFLKGCYGKQFREELLTLEEWRLVARLKKVFHIL